MFPISKSKTDVDVVVVVLVVFKRTACLSSHSKTEKNKTAESCQHPDEILLILLKDNISILPIKVLIRRLEFEEVLKLFLRKQLLNQ